ncbi:4'-phosphopantetheinyl transferase superfamily [Lipomyces arxii]|uniref:4'-phosphopantetheinyl transferase superfamily n=1 Tax=Lipomyces arxii TaxID=56418 RepID=UPI0034CE45B2
MASISAVRGFGIDLVYLPRIDALLKRNPVYRSKFSRRILHDVEFEKSKLLVDNHELHSIFLARCWSIKEALYKSLDTKRQVGFIMREWCTIDPAGGMPTISGSSLYDDEQFFVSVTHDGEYLIAAVILGFATP